MRPLIFLLAAVLILGTAALAVAGDCPGGVCPLEKNATALPSITVDIPAVVEVMAVGIVADRQPIRNTVKRIAARRLVQAKIVRRPARLLKAVVKNTQTRKPARRLVARSKRILKLPLRLLRRRR